jgi:hypothetical protein
MRTFGGSAVPVAPRTTGSGQALNAAGFRIQKGPLRRRREPTGGTTRQVPKMSIIGCTPFTPMTVHSLDPLMLDTEFDVQPLVNPSFPDTALPEAMLCSYDD